MGSPSVCIRVHLWLICLLFLRGFVPLTAASLPVVNNFTGFTGANLGAVAPGWFEASITTTAGAEPGTVRGKPAPRGGRRRTETGHDRTDRAAGGNFK